MKASLVAILSLLSLIACSNRQIQTVSQNSLPSPPETHFTNLPPHLQYLVPPNAEVESKEQSNQYLQNFKRFRRIPESDKTRFAEPEIFHRRSAKGQPLNYSAYIG